MFKRWRIRRLKLHLIRARYHVMNWELNVRLDLYPRVARQHLLDAQEYVAIIEEKLKQLGHT